MHKSRVLYEVSGGTFASENGFLELELPNFNLLDNCKRASMLWVSTQSQDFLMSFLLGRWKVEAKPGDAYHQGVVTFSPVVTGMGALDSFRLSLVFLPI